MIRQERQSDTSRNMQNSMKKIEEILKTKTPDTELNTAKH